MSLGRKKQGVFVDKKYIVAQVQGTSKVQEEEISWERWPGGNPYRTL